jgi:hypothetical protein
VVVVVTTGLGVGAGARVGDVDGSGDGAGVSNTCGADAAGCGGVAAPDGSVMYRRLTTTTCGRGVDGCGGVRSTVGSSGTAADGRTASTQGSATSGDAGIEVSAIAVTIPNAADVLRPALMTRAFAAA